MQKIGLLVRTVSWLDKVSLVALAMGAICYLAYFFDGLPEALEEEAWQETHPGIHRFWADDMITNYMRTVCYSILPSEAVPDAMDLHRYLKTNIFEILDSVIFTHKPIKQLPHK